MKLWYKQAAWIVLKNTLPIRNGLLETMIDYNVKKENNQHIEHTFWGIILSTCISEKSIIKPLVLKETQLFDVLTQKGQTISLIGI